MCGILGILNKDNYSKVKLSTLIEDKNEIKQYWEDNKVNFENLNLVLFAVDWRKMEQHRTLIGNAFNK